MNIVVITAITLPEISDVQMRAMRDAAGPDARITVVASEAEALEHAAETEIILGIIDARLFSAAEHLRWVHATASGVDFMLFPDFVASEVVLTGEKGLVGSHLADHAIGLLLTITRRIAAAVRDGPASWQHRVSYRQEELELEGLMLGILGYGGTGRALARRGAGFGMRLRALDLHAVDGDVYVPEVEPAEALPRMLAESDVVAVCLPLTPVTRAMIDERRIAMMKPGAIIINVTRGEIIDHPALVAALTSGHLGGAGLDVHHLEPLPEDDPLWRLPNVVMTPHTAGASQLRAGRNLDRFIENLRRYRKGDPLLGLVDKQLGY